MQADGSARRHVGWQLILQLVAAVLLIGMLAIAIVGLSVGVMSGRNAAGVMALHVLELSGGTVSQLVQFPLELPLLLKSAVQCQKQRLLLLATAMTPHW